METRADRACPAKPESPTEADCCHSDCAPNCVFDVYERDLLRWQLACERAVQSAEINCPQ